MKLRTLCIASLLGLDHGDADSLASAFTEDGVLDFRPAGRKLGIDFPQLTNRQAILFTPVQGAITRPSVAVRTQNSAGQLLLSISGQPAQRCVLSASEDLKVWTKLATNMIPASGEWVYTNSGAGMVPQKFYRAALGP